MAEEKKLTREQTAQMSDEEFFRAYQEGKIARRADALTEENWEEEIEKIPIFMTKQPDADDVEANEQLEAMRAMLLDDNDPDELAKYSKEHGNAAFKSGKAAKEKKLKLREFRKALQFYTDGINAKCEDKELVSILHTNRAAVNLILGNCRMTIGDCVKAKKLNPKNVKSYWRAAKSFYKLERYNEAIQWCDEGLLVDPSNVELAKERQGSVKAKAVRLKAERKKAREQREKEKKEKLLESVIKDRGITVKGPLKCDEMPGEVFVNSEGALIWPVALLYPEFKRTDFIAEFAEFHTWNDHLAAMLPATEVQDWDSNKQYRAGNVDIYYEYRVNGKAKLAKVPGDQRLFLTLKEKNFVVENGTPSFLAIAKDSAFGKAFLKNY